MRTHLPTDLLFFQTTIPHRLLPPPPFSDIPLSSIGNLLFSIRSASLFMHQSEGQLRNSATGDLVSPEKFDLSPGRPRVGGRRDILA